MKFKEIKISEEKMSALVDKFFTAIDINRERLEHNAKVDFFNLESNTISMIDVKVLGKLEFTKEDIEQYYNKYDIENIQRPYISLISDNCTNELQVYISQCTDDSVLLNDLDCKSVHVSRIDDKYLFMNL